MRQVAAHAREMQKPNRRDLSIVRAMFERRLGEASTSVLVIGQD